MSQSQERQDQWEIGRLRERCESLSRELEEARAELRDANNWERAARQAISASAASLTQARAEIERLREACRIALLHAPGIRLAPERRHTIAVLERALTPPPSDSAEGT